MRAPAHERHQRVAEHAGGAGVDKGRDIFRSCFLKQVQRAGDVDVNEVLASVGRHMRLVKGCGVQNGSDTVHAGPYEVAVGDRANLMRESAGAIVDTDDVAPLRLQRTDQRLAEMSGTAGHQNCQAVSTSIAGP